MVICRSYVFEFSVNKNMNFVNNDKKDNSSIFSNTNCQKKKNVEQGRLVTTARYNQTLNILFRVTSQTSQEP